MSVTAAAGFRAGGVACGIKPDGALDLALVTTEGRAPAAAAGVFTTNRATAAPVLVSRVHLSSTGGRAVAVVLNSGNANAASGAQGRADAARTCALVAAELGCRPEEVLVCSTGLIGIPLPMGPVASGVPTLTRSLRADGGPTAAEAIRTTDTVRKEVVVDTDAGFVVGGMAKGSAMLAPDMATMLAVLTTDAEATPQQLDDALRAAMPGSFHALSVDGCTSTNDTVLLLASGASGRSAPGPLAEAVAEACASLARQMAGDAEGATKVVEVRVEGAASDEDAARAARAVAESVLCKCSWYGCDPYWGRVVSELGSSGAAFDPDAVAVAYGPVTVCRHGVACPHDAGALATVMAAPHLSVNADLGLGAGSALVLTNDLTHAYVDENMGTS
ncbi:MAG: bifunctional glutamate N-acetyltransferase/amino-acid acetyltransferase ArgJ [Actinomycetota bacterium]|nr:bifunctional glutamate N-acetyltransferase/amino-acid acetyltransferase ArgJ [Actinomycetota bacterium]